VNGEANGGGSISDESRPLGSLSPDRPAQSAHSVMIGGGKYASSESLMQPHQVRDDDEEDQWRSGMGRGFTKRGLESILSRFLTGQE
jgi:hypothetical protein